jgi:hypothetical protein
MLLFGIASLPGSLQLPRYWMIPVQKANELRCVMNFVTPIICFSKRIGMDWGRIATVDEPKPNCSSRVGQVSDSHGT